MTLPAPPAPASAHSRPRQLADWPRPIREAVRDHLLTVARQHRLMAQEYGIESDYRIASLYESLAQEVLPC